MNYAKIRQRNRKSKVHTQAGLWPLNNIVVVQVNGKRYAPIRARTEAFVVEAWHFLAEDVQNISKVLQNCTTQNYANSITYQVLSFNY